MCAYVAATAAGNWSTRDVVEDTTSDGWNGERARQARWRQHAAQRSDQACLISAGYHED